MDSVKMREAVEAGKTILGIEFGSTRIKAVLTNEEDVYKRQEEKPEGCDCKGTVMFMVHG